MRVLDMTLNNLINSGALGNMEYSFIAIALRYTLTWSGNTWQGPIYGSNRTVWHLNCVQINHLCKTELLEIELFDHLTVCKQVTDVLIELLVIYNNTWNHLTVCKWMKSIQWNN